MEELKKRCEELVKKLNEASRAYYGGQEEVMSNYEWDAMFDELASLEAETGYVLPDSPTQNTGIEENNGDREPHEFPALSLAKTKKVSDLQKWAEDKPVWLSWKLDGLTLVLTYDSGKLSKIVTRGNGTVGTNITYLKNAIAGFPLKINYQGHMVVRGEATISYTDFALLNDTIEDDDEKYANPRNLASGTLALDDPEKVRERHVHFNAFTLVYLDDPLKSWGERMDLLEREGFTVIDREAVTAESLPEAISRWTAKVESGEMDIPVDGLVICYDDTDYAATGSVTGHHATRAGYAFKWQDVSAKSKLSYVEWSCAASTISPVAVFEPVLLEGTTVSRASLCNISEMERLGIGKSCTLEVIKANKIIPKCIGVTEAEGEFEIPKTCPVCGAPTEIRISEKSKTKTLHCTNPDCSAKHVKKFTRFVSKSGMDIDGLSIQTMLRFMNEGFISDFADIYHLSEHAEVIRNLDGFGEKSCDNMMRAIEKSRRVHPVNFIYAICIPMFGLDAGKKIVSAIGFDGFLKRLKDGTGFEDIEGIGPEKSGSAMDWYANPKNQQSLGALLKEIVIEKVDLKPEAGGKCEGLTFVITGDVHHFKNRDEFKGYVEKTGGKVTGSVTSKTNYLVNNDVNSTSSKNRKAKELSVPIISEDEFVERFGRE
ncbi:MAG: NAD-dependent DNA ligase LigA [Lachnospiraceae bacterium]|nr:NAD-dependent DNA ligase LigA [Lachnospiraceae bacterium]MDD7627598.1 NAD-dependent DNA ligase LigA [Lachnospiraceae bacterium]MDY4120269.1 NAD-dependent DNA ligase LigA [Lachnospiraceae bacterium]